MAIFAIIALFAIVGIGLFFKQPAVKGKCGELMVAYCLKRFLDKNNYRIINNVLIPDGLGGTTQIDHVVLSPYGIFVVETKNMKGWIFGNRNSRMWMQQIFRCKNQFQNPFFQNYKHIVSLAAITGLPENVFVHVVVFLGDCELKNRAELPEALVCNASELRNFIGKFQTPVLDGFALIDAVSLIDNARLANSRSNKCKHIEYLNSIHQAQVERPDPPESM
jgi:hypothetical protein